MMRGMELMLLAGIVIRLLDYFPQPSTDYLLITDPMADEENRHAQ